MFSPVFPLLAQASGSTGGGGPGALLVPVACFAVIVYFGIMRPQQKRTKDQQSLVANLKTGDKVVTSGGIHGIVANVKEGATLSLKVADNVRIEVDKTAIATVEKSPDALVVKPA